MYVFGGITVFVHRVGWCDIIMGEEAWLMRRIAVSACRRS